MIRSRLSLLYSTLPSEEVQSKSPPTITRAQSEDENRRSRLARSISFLRGCNFRGKSIFFSSVRRVNRAGSSGKPFFNDFSVTTSVACC